MIRPFQDFLRPGSIGDPTKVLVAAQSEDLNAPGFQLVEGIDYSQFPANEFEDCFYWQGVFPNVANAFNIWAQNTAASAPGTLLATRDTGIITQRVFNSTGSDQLDITQANLAPLFDGNKHLIKAHYNVDGQIKLYVNSVLKGQLSTLHSLDLCSTDWIALGATGPAGLTNLLESGIISGYRRYARIPKQGDLCTQHYQLDCDGVNFQAKRCPWSSNAPVFELRGRASATPTATVAMFFSGRDNVALNSGLAVYKYSGRLIASNATGNAFDIPLSTIPELFGGESYVMKFMWSGDMIQFYLNGNLIDSAYSPWVQPATDKVIIGAEWNGAYPMQTHTVNSFRVYES